ncbi:MAG TPA: T9SS type A sorting domain-containing protein [Saprospiraceae bacterium]|nr:T9SS type A sorting domain-containing protein [Saprospiraceae bacterium]
MKISTFIFVFFLVSSNLIAQPTIEWQHLLGGVNIDGAYEVKPTLDGGYMVTGSSLGMELPGSHGDFDWVVTKLAENGTIQKQRLIGGSNNENQPKIGLKTGGGYFMLGTTYSSDGDVAGHHGSTDGWVVTLDDTLGIDWQRCIGGSYYDNMNNFMQTTDGSYVISGGVQSTDGDILVNYGNSDFFIIKLKPDGDTQWKRTFGGSDYDQANYTIQTSDGGYILAGVSKSTDGQVGENHGEDDIWILKLSSFGIIQWKKVLGGSQDESVNQVIQVSDGGFVIAGSTRSNDLDVSGHHGLKDIWMVKLSSDGQLEWEKAIGGTQQDNPGSLDQTEDGGLLLTGHTTSNDGDITGNHGYQDVWIVKFDIQGNILWGKTIGGSSEDFLDVYKPTPDGGLVFGGFSSSANGDITQNKGDRDGWLLKLDENYDIQWSITFGGSNKDVIQDILVTDDGGYLFVGYTRSNNGDVSGLLHGEDDIWIVKLTSESVGTKFSNSSVSQNGLSIYPNPAVHQVQLTLPVASPLLDVQIYPIWGGISAMATISNGGSLDISHLPAGIFIARVQDESGSIYMQKFEIQH